MRILYVEDNQQDADLARIEIGRGLPGAEVFPARLLSEARARIDAEDRFDVIVCDLNLPDGTGLELVVGIRQKDISVPIVMLTGSGDERTAVAALKAGVDDYLVKRGDYLRQLPGVIKAVMATVATAEGDAARITRPLRVLYAEHHALDVELTRRHLARHAAHIVLDNVTDADGARRVITENPGAHDVLLLDYRLIGTNALELLRELRDSRSPALPVVLVTGQGDEAVAVEALRLGASDYLVKRPGYLHELPATLENAFSRALLARERAALRASEAAGRLREEALQTLPQGVLLCDGQRRILYANPAFTRLTGYTLAEIVGGTCSFLQGPQTDPQTVALMRDALTAGRPFEGELLNYRKDGTSFWNQLSLTPVLDADGRVINIIGVQQDVSERRRTEEALRASEERFRQIAENIHEVFWMTDPERHTMLYISPAYEQVWGRPCASILARPSDWMKAVHPDDRQRVAAAAGRQTRGDYNEVYRIVRPDGTIRWVRDRAYPIRNESGEVYRLVGTAEDITEQRQLEGQLLQAQKMEAIGTLAGGIAHDFNNILAAIMGYTELLQMQLGDNAEVRSYLAALQQAGTRATALVRQILAFSRRGDHERRSVSLERIIKEPLALLRATIPSTIAFDVRLESGLPPVLADATQVHQVLMNLGTNAAHAMRDQSGTLTVGLSQVEVTAAQARGSTNLRPGRYELLIVGDTGSGMSRDTIKRIFEPFFTTKDPGEGTGLGLSVVHGIMQAHEGDIQVDSTPGQGTVFRLYFPLDQNAENAVEAPDESGQPLRGEGERVLLVDDEEPIVHVGRLMLHELGYDAEATCDAEVALERVRANPGEFALVITDLTMPGMTGVDLVRGLASIRPDLPVIITTGYNATLTDEKIRALGVSSLVLKPFTLLEISRAVRRALDVSNHK
ncbi:MAG: response regulator [Verrucomicrobiota bacterium]